MVGIASLTCSVFVRILSIFCNNNCIESSRRAEVGDYHLETAVSDGWCSYSCWRDHELGEKES